MIDEGENGSSQPPLVCGVLSRAGRSERHASELAKCFDQPYPETSPQAAGKRMDRGELEMYSTRREHRGMGPIPLSKYVV